LENIIVMLLSMTIVC